MRTFASWSPVCCALSLVAACVAVSTGKAELWIGAGGWFASAAALLYCDEATRARW